MLYDKITISGENVVNQQRFPKNRFGWPLMEAALIIIEGKPGWRKNAEARIQSLVNLRNEMKTLSDLYGHNCLNKWDIDHLFVPWFSMKPVKTNTLADLDYTQNYLKSSSIVEKLCSLISSIEKRKYVEPQNITEEIIGYPLNSSKKYYYIRAGNHRAAVLSALGFEIPLVIDKFAYLKLRDQKIVRKKSFFWRLGKKSLEYPYVASVADWPAVRNKVLDINDAKKILQTFYKE